MPFKEDTTKFDTELAVFDHRMANDTKAEQFQTVERNQDFSPTMPRRDLWLIISTMKDYENSSIVRPYGRLKLISAGLALAVVGCVLLLRSVDVVIHWTGQPMFSWGLIAAGGLCILLAVIPASWIANAATTSSKTGRHR